MNEDELIKEATELPEWWALSMIDRPLFVRGYITGAEAKLSELDIAKHLLNRVMISYSNDEEMHELLRDIKQFLSGE